MTRQPGELTVAATGEPLECLICGHDRFNVGERLLNTSFLSAFGLDWANRSAWCAICQRCSYIHWFLLEG